MNLDEAQGLGDRSAQPGGPALATLRGGSQAMQVGGFEPIPGSLKAGAAVGEVALEGLLGKPGAAGDGRRVELALAGGAGDDEGGDQPLALANRRSPGAGILRCGGGVGRVCDGCLPRRRLASAKPVLNISLPSDAPHSDLD